MTLEHGVRFLADFLGGNTYYKTTRATQDLDANVSLAKR